VSIPKFTSDVMNDHKWQQVMLVAMGALKANNTLKHGLVISPPLCLGLV